MELLPLASNFIKICSKGPINKKSAFFQILDWRQTLIWTNGSMEYWRIHTSLSLDEWKHSIYTNTNCQLISRNLHYSDVIMSAMAFQITAVSIGSLGPTFYTPLKVVAMSTWNNTDVKPVKTFWENNQRPEFWACFGTKNWASDAHTAHISESSSNEHIKQDWWESRGNALTKRVENLNFDLVGGPKLGLWPLLHTYKSSSKKLKNQVSSGNFSRK